MIRAALYSEDHELQRLFVSAFGEVYQIARGFSEEAINELLRTDKCEAVYLDLSSERSSVQRRVDFAKKIVVSPVWSTVIADDCVEDTAINLVKLGADGYRRKSSFTRELESLVENKGDAEPLLRSQVAGRQPLPSESKRLIGNSAQMQAVFELICKVADLDAPVLITGESGTGKELVARTIHDTGAHACRPFVALSCSAIPETLLEAELFGHEKGAFTGSIGAREGYFERAASGTLFLDEIGDLTLHAQVKLLRVLQERSFSRLGSSRLIPLQARLLFATHRDLAEMVKDKIFREDLYYRINVIRIETPPLRDRLEDITELAEHFMHRYATEFGRPIQSMSSEVLELLHSYYWPGNIRELENVVQRAVAISSQQIICKEDLPSHISRNNVIGISAESARGSLDQELLDHKIRLAEEALRKFDGNKSLAARSLGISRPYLYKLIQLGGLEPVPRTC